MSVNFKRMALLNLHMMGGFVAKSYSTTILRRPRADAELVEEALQVCCRSEVLLDDLDSVIAGAYNAKLFAVWHAEDIRGRPRLAIHSAALYGKPSPEIAGVVAAVEEHRGWKRGSYEIHAIRSLPNPAVGRMVVFNVIADLMSRRGRSGYTVHQLWWHIAKDNGGAAAIRRNLASNRWQKVQLSWLPPAFRTDPGNTGVVEAVRAERLWVLLFDDARTRREIAKRYALTSGSQIASERVCSGSKRCE